MDTKKGLVPVLILFVVMVSIVAAVVVITQTSWGQTRLANITSDPKQVDLNIICSSSGSCPAKYCRTACVGGGPQFGCVLGCVPKDCQDFPADFCPTDRCKIMANAANEDVCYYDFSSNSPTPSCGHHGYYGQDVACCEGLVHRYGKVNQDGTCDMTGYKTSFPSCLECGNGQCDSLENKCNCPEDCSN